MYTRYQRLGTIGTSSERPRKWHDRTPLFAVFLALVGAIFVWRLFYLQIIKHDDYQAAATAEQYKKFSIPAERGRISVLQNGSWLPVVLNEDRYLIYADPALVDDPGETAKKVAMILGIDSGELERLITLESRYVVLAKKVERTKVDELSANKLKGIVAKKEKYRTYPEGYLASQILGFVNDEGAGQYGIEEYMDEALGGKPGLLKGITDVNGVPLVGTADDIIEQPTDGKDIVLTIDATIQRISEEAIKSAVESTNSSGGSVVIMDVRSGAVKAMANWPSYNPKEFEKVTDLNLFKNRVVTDPLEVGSIMKTLTVSSALDQGLIGSDSTYFDKGYEQVGEFRITNAINFGEGQFSIFDVIRNSLNTGAVHLLKAMGGGEINDTGRKIWHDYMTNHFGFGVPTGIEQAGEAPGLIPDPMEGDGLNIQYANTVFGQGMTVTPLQMAAALSSAVNGGNYYKPYLVQYVVGKDGKSVETEAVLEHRAISEQASSGIVSLMQQYASMNNREAARTGFSVGGKTGTAQIPNGQGGYREDVYNGTYAGFVGGSKPEFVIIVRIDAPRISGFAGSAAARPIFTTIANGIMDNIGLDHAR